MKKKIIFNKNAAKEIRKLPEPVEYKIATLLKFLAIKGRLDEPEAKKIDKNLFELRVKLGGQWRAFYAYVLKDCIVLLSVFNKKTQQTPQREIDKAKKRLEDYS